MTNRRLAPQEIRIVRMPSGSCWPLCALPDFAPLGFGRAGLFSALKAWLQPQIVHSEFAALETIH